MSHATALCINHKRPNTDMIKFRNVTLLSPFKPEMDSMNFVNAIASSVYDRRATNDVRMQSASERGPV